MKIEEMLTNVAVVRADVEAARETMEAAQQAMWDTPEGIAWKAAVSVYEGQRGWLAQEENGVREAIVDAYDLTGNKKPADGAGVRIIKKVRYDLDEAVAWCKENAPAFLSLAAKPFEKAVLSGLPGAPAEIEEEPQATLARDLSKYLGDW